MANLNVTVSKTTGFYTIDIDWNDWETFTVYDGSAPKKVISVVPGQHTKYGQTSAGPLKFVLTAKTNTIVNPQDVTGYDGTLAGNGTANYYLICNFKNPKGDQENWKLTGYCSQAAWTADATSPSTFSSIHMTGSFATTA